MIERQPLGGYDVHCDHCSHVDSYDADDWGELLSEMRRDGWRFDEVSGEWEHTCPSCAEEGDESDGGGMPDESW